MKRLLPLILALFAVSCTQIPSLAPKTSPYPELASVVLIKENYNNAGMKRETAGCGATAIGKHLLVTASHCVGPVGSAVNYVTRDLWFTTTNAEEPATVLESNKANDVAYLKTNNELPAYVSVRAARVGEPKLVLSRFKVYHDYTNMVGVLSIELNHGFSGSGVFGEDGMLLGVTNFCNTKEKVIVNNNAKCSMGGNYSPLL